MSDKYNDFNDDFFAQFDELDKKQNENSTDIDTFGSDFGGDEFFYGGGKDYRKDKNEKPTASRSERAARAQAENGIKSETRAKRHAKLEKQKAKLKEREEYLAAKAKEKAKAEFAAAASKLDGSAADGAGRSQSKKGPRWLAAVKTVIAIGLLAVFAAGIYVGVVFLKAPIIDTDDIYAHISQRSIMYDTDGNEIDNLYFTEGNRTVIKYKEIPKTMVDAVVAIEDQKFWKHSGFNFIRMVGAVRDSVFGGGDISGTSTVSQQLARNVYLADIKSQRTLSRKITEMYVTIILEKDLSKEQIMEAYLNTIYLGFNSYGVQAAAESYFDRDAKDLNLEQCAALAALPSSPDVYALVYSDYYNTYTDLPKIEKTDSVTYLYNGDLTKERRELVLSNMLANGFISEQECQEAKAADLQKEIKISAAENAKKSSYFTDYALGQVIDDIMEEYDISEVDAQNMVYTKGLKIYTTMDSRIQNIMEEEFADDSNFTSIAYTRTNEDGNLISDKGVVLAYKYGYYFNDDGDLLLQKGDYRKNSDGGITIPKGKRFNLYSTETESGTDISVEMKGMFKRDSDGKFYFIESGALMVPAEYKSLDESGNCVISGQFFKDYPKFFKKTDEGYVVDEDNVSLKQKIRQPQAAAVIMENKTAEVKAMMGGRGASGKQLYNRSINPRQPGSSIKPIAVYGPALQMSYEYHEEGERPSLDTSEGSDWGRFVTAGSVVNDDKTKDGNGRIWPYNDDHKYHGDQTVREALQQSLNVVSYKIYKQIERNVGAEYSIDMMEKSGITTLDPEADCNPAAIALGGTTRGITPLEETAAYAVFPNGGVYKSPIFYKKIVDSKNDLLYEKTPTEKRVYNKGVAWIMTDVLRSVVTSGIGRPASISSQPAAGKTGTTSNMYDIWFSGFTPQYSMALWMGNDINMPVSNYSYKAAGFWSSIMGRVCEDIPRASFFARPDNVEMVAGEYYIKGTYTKVTKKNSKTSKTKTETEATTTIPTTPIPSSQPSSEPQTVPSAEPSSEANSSQ